MIPHISDLNQALLDIKTGQILAYPTEAVYGLGCDPFNQKAVERLLALKQRSAQRGLIVLIADWPQLFSLIGDVPVSRLEVIKETWPGPVTWVFPKSENIPEWVCGTHNSIAIRMTAHPTAQKLCQLGPIVSTSANLHGQKPALSLGEVEKAFPTGLDGIVLGDLGTETRPTVMYDALTNHQIR
jgi:L-threonylcarbamoyladenylate synthase